MQPKLPRNELKEGKRAGKDIKHRDITSASGWRRSNTPIYSGKSIGGIYSPEYMGVLLPIICSAVMLFPRQLATVREKTLDISLVPARPLFMLVPGKEEE